MAPTPTTNSSFPFPAGKDFGGDEFSNNLFSDLAPLLTLFGEQVTKQFLSMSMGWADDVLLAMGPLGIMTVIVSTIRVGGIKVLKAFVGRARESKANAEKEILSSTSEDVCELWSGREVVRELGNAEGMKDLILLEEPMHVQSWGNSQPQTVRTLTEPTRILDISTAVTAHVLSKPIALPEEEVPAISNGAPNIALNVRNSTASFKELTVWATIATLLQISALVFPAITTYHLEWRKGGSAIARYGYPCFATGTIAVIVGMLFCGRVIEGSTTEHEFKLLSRGLGSSAQIMRLQKACTVSDQHFMSYAIFNSPDDSSIRTSRLNRTSYSRIAAAATLTAVVGFVIQFVGLRALHWSATIYQLGIMLILTVVRSLVRRGLAVDPFFYPLLDGFEVAWLSLYILKRDEERTRGLTYRHVLQTTSREPKTNQEDVQNSSLSERQRASHMLHTDNQAGLPSENTSRSPNKGASFIKVPYFKIQCWPLSITLTGAKIMQRRDPDPDERMLEPIVRWEPFTGYYNINQIQDTIRDFLNGDGHSGPIREILEVEDARLSRVFYSLADIRSTSAENDTPINSTILRDCCDLRRLVPTAGQASDTARVLCLAIERTMALLTKSQHILWRAGQHPAESFDFSGSQVSSFNLAIIRGAYDSAVKSHRQNLQISMSGKIADPTALGSNSNEPFLIWTIDREMICSILSLWLFSLELRRSTAIKTSIASRKLESFDEHVPRGLDGLIDQRNTYYRIVRSATASATKNTLDSSPKILLRWLHDTLNRMPGLGGEKRITLSRSELELDPVNTWVVWGSHLSSSTHPVDPLDANTKSTSAKRSEPDLEDIAIRTRPETSIAEHCALELYSLFIESIASQIEIIGGSTMKLQAFGEEERERWRNSLLESIANECVTVGLAHDVPEANTVIIPAFMKHDLLPKTLHKEIKWSRNKEGKAFGEVEGNKYDAPSSEHLLRLLDRPRED